MEIWSIAKLKPHELNHTLYEEINEESEAFKELLKSIQENGILQPLVVRPDGTLLSGHRRWQVASYLGIHNVPVVVEEKGDDRTLIVEYNRYRRKTASEVMREAELLKTVIKVETAGTTAEFSGRTDTKTAEAVGMKQRTFTKLEFIYEQAKVNPNAKEKLAKIDAGTLSIDAGFKALRALMPGEEGEAGPEIPDFIRFYNSWQFAENDPRFGMPHPGRIPGQIAGNIIYYYSEPDDLVVDPMAGGGSTLDVANFLGRKCLGLDVAPRRPDIKQHDISKGFPDEAKGCQLIFMDPPYWNMKDEGYVDESSSRLSLENFKEWYAELLANACHTVRVGGFVAVINMGQYFRLPDDFDCGYIDWPLFAYQEMLLQTQMRPWSRVAVTYPTSLHGGYDVESAKEGKFFLPVLGDIVVFRRVK